MKTFLHPVCLLCSMMAYAAQVRVPSELANMEGNSASTGPFSSFGVLQSYRYQQVYDASQFSILDPNGEFITHFGLRLDTDSGHGFGTLLRDVQMNLSTTPNPPDGLGTTFAQNVGIDDTVVYGRGQFLFGLSYSFGARPQPFFQLELQRPFFYKPSMGNLLYDVRIYTYTNSLDDAAPLDAANTPDDSISSLFATNVTSSTGATSSVGLVTVFFTTPIPQPTVSVMSNNLFFRWVNRPGGFILQVSSVVGPGANWQPTGGTVSTNGAYKEVTLPLSTGVAAAFFRLVLPSSSPGPAVVQTTKPSVAVSNQKR